MASTTWITSFTVDWVNPKWTNPKHKPQLIYNVNEKGINTECKPSNVVAGRGYQPQAVMAERSKTVTISGVVDAQGKSDSTFLCFSQQRMVSDLMQGKAVVLVLMES